MKFQKLTLVSLFILSCIILLQSHSAGRAGGNDRDNTGAPGGQSGGNGTQISCVNCHTGGNFEVGLNFELLDADNNLITEYAPNEIYTAKVTLETLNGTSPSGYGFQMVSLFDADDADVNGWIDATHSPNVQLSLANSTGRVYAEHDGVSDTNEFITEWQAPDLNSGDVSFYLAGVGVNGNGGSSGDHAAELIKITFPVSPTSSTSDINNGINVTVYPNPTVQNLYINGEIKNTTIEIYQSEKLVQSTKSETQNLILPLDNLSSGIYFVVIKNEENQIVSTKKVIKN